MLTWKEMLSFTYKQTYWFPFSRLLRHAGITSILLPHPQGVETRPNRPLNDPFFRKWHRFKLSAIFHRHWHVRRAIHTPYVSRIRERFKREKRLKFCFQVFQVRKYSFPKQKTFAPQRKKKKKKNPFWRNISKQIAKSLREISAAAVDIPGSPRIFKCQWGSTRLTRFNGWKYYSRSYISDLFLGTIVHGDAATETENPKPWVPRGETLGGWNVPSFQTNDEREREKGEETREWKG